ncbi:MAG: fructose-6-phosphate aldolase [bacterium]
MKIFIDTANIEEIKTASSWGIIDGVTTNPSLIAKEGKNFLSVIREITSIVDGPISAEATSADSLGIIEEGRKLSKLHKNINVKIPITPEGLKATKVLSSEGIKVNMTLIFSTNQAILAAKAGASFVSPFIGRLDDISQNGTDILYEMVEIFKKYGYGTEVIAASIRHPLHVIEAALAGVHIATIPFKVIEQMVKHPLTDKGIEKFTADWEKVKNK